MNTTRTSGQGPFPIKEAFESFSNGVHAFGPFHGHVLEYWKERLKRPHKILFLKYEEMKRDPRGQLKRLASFLGRPFIEEKMINKVLWRCSLERLKNLEVNKNGIGPQVVLISGLVLLWMGRTTSGRRWGSNSIKLLG
ncbi:hypothetical protein HHK36_015529 [Tetracentron sinense]|uniref:Sulfotransferase n=1 Tax=Tetracentron sinense TaxID=13715 RepID=A0A834Z2B0_TETSI|nr:hypothetical protein HHK36_015529 [Tetracentron sinense]